jgi:hypothetical protein
MDHGPQMHLILLPVVAIAVLGWLVYVVVRRMKDKRRSDRDHATDPDPDGSNRSHQP